MSHFKNRLQSLQSELSRSAARQWFYIPYDQLTDAFGPLSERPAKRTGIVLIETTWKARQRAYHKQKLALVLANQRHFALEQSQRGVAVDYRLDSRRYSEVLEDVIDTRGGLTMMQPAERELRVDLADLVDRGDLEVISHGGWLTSPADFRASQGDPPWRMDAFYRHVRRRSEILMDGDQPIGDKFSFDDENREFWPGTPTAPSPPRFEPDAVTREVGALIERHFDDHPGRLDLAAVATTQPQADAAWQWALDECMTHFGAFEDAMSTESRTLFHTRVSPLINLHRIPPKRALHDVLALDIPLNSKEGFVRQLLGWREFMNHVHRRTDGFRNPDIPTNILEAHRPLPPAYWGARSGLRCLDEVVQSVLDEGWSHHITRLMVLSNIATLIDTDPQQLSDWFWELYIDAFDWVVEPNVLGMGTFSMGDLFTTKPYVSGSNYINKMSDYCSDCQFDPKGNCPLRRLYWAFLQRHREVLSQSGRMNLILANASRRSKREKERDRRVFDEVTQLLADGDELSPEALRLDKG